MRALPGHVSSAPRYKVFDVNDESADAEPLGAAFEEASDFIEEGRAAGGVIVHCMAGVSVRARKTRATPTPARTPTCLDLLRLVRLHSVLVAFLRVLRVCAQRSSSCICAFLISRYGMTPGDAIQLVRSSRPVCTPNMGFLAQLHDWAAKKGGAAI